jgi:uncharacterized iron-regulated membrane protein
VAEDKQSRTSFLTSPRRTRLRKVAFQIHLYGGLGAGLMLVALGASGSAIVLREPIQFALHRISHPKPMPSGPASLDRALQDFLATHAGSTIKSVDGFDRTDGLLALDTNTTSSSRDRYYFIDRATGRQVAAHESLSAALDFLDDFHRNLLAGRKGRGVNGIVALLFCATVLSGLIVWWPGMARWSRSIFVNWSLSWKRINYDSHSAIGFWCFSFLLLMSVTATVLATPSIASLFQSADKEERHHHSHNSSGAANAQTGKQLQVQGDGSSKDPRSHMKHDRTAPQGHAIDEMVQALSQTGYQLRAVELDDSGAPARLELEKGRNTEIADWDAQQRTIRSLQESSIPGISLDAHGFVDVLHFGRIGGIWTQSLWAAMGLSPIAMVVTGFLMWWNRVLSKRLQRHQ